MGDVEGNGIIHCVHQLVNLCLRFVELDKNGMLHNFTVQRINALLNIIDKKCVALFTRNFQLKCLLLNLVFDHFFVELSLCLVSSFCVLQANELFVILQSLSQLCGKFKNRHNFISFRLFFIKSL